MKKDVDSVLAYLENEEVIDYEKNFSSSQSAFFIPSIYMKTKYANSYDPETEKQELMEENLPES